MLHPPCNTHLAHYQERVSSWIFNILISIWKPLRTILSIHHRCFDSTLPLLSMMMENSKQFLHHKSIFLTPFVMIIFGGWWWLFWLLDAHQAWLVLPVKQSAVSTRLLLYILSPYSSFHHILINKKIKRLSTCSLI